MMSKERELLKKLLESNHFDSMLTGEWRYYIKELLAQPEQTEQEPVAWKVVDKTTRNYMFSRIKPNARSYTYDEVIPLYTSPPKREPLSDECLKQIREREKFDYYVSQLLFNTIAKRIEKEHEIGDK